MVIRRFFNANKIEIFLIGGLVLLSLLPRIIDLGTFLTADEKNWIGRSYEFIRAFKDWRFNDMLQTTHPGVTTLWLAGVFVSARMIFWHVPFSFENLIHFVEFAQLPIALVNVLFIPVVYWLLKKLFEKRSISLAGAVLVALDPIVIGYSRLVHVDALLMNFMLVSALCLLLYMKKGFSWTWLTASAVFGGLSFLTKAPAVFLIPYFVLALIFFCPRVFFDKRLFLDRSRELVLWVMIAGLVFVLLWPAILWVQNPEGNVLLLKRDIGRAVATPHHMTESYSVNWSFYLFTLLTRTSSLIQFFWLVFLVWLVAKTKRWLVSDGLKKRGGEDKQALRLWWLLLLYVFFFVLMMTLGAKKGDRYILPVFPVIDIMAAGGIFVVIDSLFGVVKTLVLKRKRFEARSWVLKRLIGVVVVSGVVGSLAYTAYNYHPYAIAYSNPFWPDDLSQELGWGEGLEQVGEWLNGHAPQAVVASWYPEELAAYTTAQVAHINAHEQGKARYIVLYKNMFGRAPDHPANDFIDEYYKKRRPVFIAYVAGKEFAWVYEKPVYERVVGELEAGERVGQELNMAEEKWVGLDVMVATYQGEAKIGSLVISVKDKPGGNLIGQWERKVEDIEDDSWLRLKMGEALPLETRSLFVEIRAKDTFKGNAPTVRYTRDNDYRDTKMFIWRRDDGYKRKEIGGDLALRLLYEKNGQVVTDDDTKLVGGL